MAKWTKEAVEVLIDAYKNEPCLYAAKNPNYHNKHLRMEALNRICTIVTTIRPNTTEKDCSVKFHNLRNQFNCENAKVRGSLKSGIGTENPNLWYYESLKFLEEHVVPRKSRTSQIPNSTESVSLLSIQDSQESISDSLYENDVISMLDEETFEFNNNNNNNEEESQIFMSLPVTEVTVAVDQPISKPKHSQSISSSTSSHSMSSAASSSSTHYNALPSNASPSNASSSTYTRIPKKRKAHNQTENAYIGAIESIAQSLKTPIPTPANNMIDNTNPVDTCMSFLGSLIKTLQPEMRLDIMNSLVQTVLKASAINIGSKQSDMRTD